MIYTSCLICNHTKGYLNTVQIIFCDCPIQLKLPFTKEDEAFNETVYLDRLFIK